MKSEQYTLQQECNFRVLEDMISEVKKLAGHSPIVLVIDKYTTPILSSFLTVPEVLNKGVFALEKLESDRQAYPKYHAIYFVAPEQETIDLVLKDFEDKKKPSYSRVHLFFARHLVDSLMNKLVDERIANRVVSFKEANLNFLVTDKNLYELGVGKSLSVFSKLDDAMAVSKLASIIKERLSTVCATLGEYPLIAFQKDSVICKAIAERMDAELDLHFTSITPNAKKGILLICDRTIDVLFPLLTDYSYRGLVYAFCKTDGKEVRISGKSHTLDWKDDLWQELKNKHFGDAVKHLKENYSEFMKSDVGKAGNFKEMDNFEEMSKALGNVKEYKEKTNQFEIHFEIAGEINKLFESMNIDDLIDLEQMIATGRGLGGKEAKKTTVNTRMAKYKQTIEELSQIEKLMAYKRLTMLIHASFNIKEKQIADFLDSERDSDKKCIFNMANIGVRFEEGKERKSPIISKEEVKQIESKFEETGRVDVRQKSRLAEIIEQASNYIFGESLEVIGDKSDLPELNKNFGKKGGFGRSEATEEKPNLLLFVVGGLGQNEIAKIEALEGNVNHNLVVGSTSILTPNKYVEDIEQSDSVKWLTGDEIKLQL